MTDTPALHRITDAAYRQGLPVPRTPLIGRASEVDAVERLLEQTWLVTITGEGGVGKTRLAIEVARRQRRRVVFVSLADVQRPGFAGAVFRACTAGAPSRLSGPIAAGAHTVAGVWAGLAMEIAADPLVLVLDTFEHLRAAAVLLAEIQSAIPDLTVLVTSRCRLGLHDERVVPLTGLPPATSAAALFVERSRDIGGDRHSTAGSQELAIEEICRLLGGVPLAIELAADRTALMSPTALLAQLRSPGGSRVLGLLARGPVDLPNRQRSLRATMSWSYQLLDGDQQILFRRLAVFPTSFSLDAAEQVCTGIGPDGEWFAPDALLNGLAALVDLHLVEPVPDHDDLDPEDARYTMNDATRTFAAELLEMSGEVTAVVGRRRDWCVAFGHRAERGLASAAQHRWLARVDGELPSIRQTLMEFAQNQDVINGLSLACAIGGFWTVRGPFVEAEQWFRTFLELERAGGRPATQLRATAAGWADTLGRAAGHRVQLAAMREARATVVDQRCSVTVWLQSTDHLLRALLANPPSAVNGTEIAGLIDEGLERARQSEDSYWRCLYLYRRAELIWLAGPAENDGLVGVPDVQEAFACAQEAHAVAHDDGHHRLAARSLSLIAACRTARREWSAARDSMQTALTGLRECGDLSGAIDAMTGLAAILAHLGASGQAAGLLRDSMNQARRIGYGNGEINTILVIIFLARRHGRRADAADMDDALHEQLADDGRSLPTGLLVDSTVGIVADRPVLGGQAGLRISGRRWGWLRIRALEIAAEITAEIAVTAEVVENGADPASGTMATTVVVSALSPAHRPEPDEAATIAPSPRRPRGAQRHELTARELQILGAIASGKTNAQIAADLFLSAKTVMHHSTSIYRKLEVGGRAEAVALAYRTGLLHAPSI